MLSSCQVHLLTNLLAVARVYNANGTEEFQWEEPTPDSEYCTRVVGECLLGIMVSYGGFPGLLMAEERAENILGFLLHLQQQSIDLEEGFQVEYGGEEYDFLPKFKDRSVKSSEGSSIQMKCKSMKVVY